MPPQGGDHPTRQAPIGTGQFQSTPPHGRQPSLIRSWAAAAWAFQSTPPHGRRRGGSFYVFAVRIRFNPRLRTGGDRLCAWAWTWRSSFNPRLRTGGDHFPADGHKAALNVSIHASAREATPCSQCADDPYLVSIHASAREATVISERSDRETASFNPRLRTGGDLPMTKSGVSL